MLPQSSRSFKWTATRSPTLRISELCQAVPTRLQKIEINWKAIQRRVSFCICGSASRPVPLEICHVGGLFFLQKICSTASSFVWHCCVTLSPQPRLGSFRSTLMEHKPIHQFHEHDVRKEHLHLSKMLLSNFRVSSPSPLLSPLPPWLLLQP